MVKRATRSSVSTGMQVHSPALRCAVLCCAVLCSALLCCAVLFCSVASALSVAVLHSILELIRETSGYDM
jgi:hypothetical protein